MSAAAVVPVDGGGVVARILEKPSRVVQVIRMMAVAMSVAAGAPMETDAEIAGWMLHALETWNEEWEKFYAASPGTLSEDEVAGAYIDYARKVNYCGWGDILRQGTN